MEFSTRPKWHALNDLVVKLGMLPSNHPDRWRLARMIRDLRGELDRKSWLQGELFPDPVLMRLAPRLDGAL